MKKGILYGVGVGPGDPELITLKAVRVLKEAQVVFAAASSNNQHSLAVQIAAAHLKQGTDVRLLSFPMTKDKEMTIPAWQKNAREIKEELDLGKNAAFLTLGDPMTYSTFGYILKQMQGIDPEADIRSVPGICSHQAAAARLNTPLVEDEESLVITSGALGGERLRGISRCVENVVLFKAYRNTRDINDAMEETGFLKNSVAVSHCGRQEEQIIKNVRDLETRAPDYWTLVLAKKNGNEPD
ncbi:MAG: precorrin-2 C(20)-methyltransferase [Thermodesulfobacteriota bacterium]